MHYVANEHVYGHHKHRASLLASIREGCAICHSFRQYLDGENPELKNFGYFSVFRVELDRECSVDRPMMRVDFANAAYGFEFFPLGKTRFAIIPR